MKRKYDKPSINEVLLQHSATLMTGSVQVISPGQPNKPAGGRGFDSFDNWDYLDDFNDFNDWDE